MDDGYRNLIDLIAMTDRQAIDRIDRFIGGLAGRTPPVVTEDFLYLDTGHPICLVSHIDTLREPDDTPDVILRDGIVSNRNGVLGADDRAGVYALMQITEHLRLYGKETPSLLFTNHEEIGRIGAKNFVACNILNTTGLRLFVEFDRRGSNDYVCYGPGVVPAEVRRYIEGFGFQQGVGSSSDVQVLMEATGIPAVNLSIGYYREHTRKEHLVLSEMESSINRGISICGDPIDRLYPVEETISRTMSDSDTCEW